jgi:hypothetical protein
MPPKKKLDNGPAKGSMAALLARMSEDFGVRAKTATDYSKDWRFLKFRDPHTKLPSIAHEYLLQACGFRAGTVNQFRGLAATGKSSLCYLEYGSSLLDDSGSFCAHIETEGAGMSDTRTAQFGVDPSSIALPDGCGSFEEAVAFVDTFRCIIRGGDGGSINDMGRKSATKFKKEDAEDPDCTKPILIGIDSLSNLGKEDNTKLDIADMSKTAQLSWLTVKIREWLRQKARVYERDLLTLFLTTHETQLIKIGPMAGYGPPEKTSVAGNAIKMFDTVAIDFAKKDWKDRNNIVVGDELQLKTFKNKLGRAGKHVSLFLTKENGFDMIHSDAEFLLGKDSPFADGAGIFDGTRLCYRHAGGITCRPLGDRAFKSEEEFVRAFYDNKDVLDTCRDGMRIYGYGLPHETKYRNEFVDGVYVGPESEVKSYVGEENESPETEE